MDPPAGPDLLEAGKDDCHTPRRPLDQSCLQLETRSINQAKRVPETRKTREDDLNIYLQPDRSNRDNDLTSDMTAEDSSKL